MVKFRLSRRIYISVITLFKYEKKLINKTLNANKALETLELLREKVRKMRYLKHKLFSLIRRIINLVY